MGQRTFRYELQLGALTLPVDAVEGVEELGRPFRLVVRARSALELVARDHLRATAALTCIDDAGPARRIEGVLTDVAVAATREAETALRVVLEGRWALLGYGEHMRVFRDQSVVDIARELLGAHGIDIDARLTASYPARPQCLQWRESALDFVMRLFEEEGIVAFEHDGKLVLADARSCYPRLAGALPFRSTTALERDDEAVTRIDSCAELGPASVVARDWSRAAPRRSLRATARLRDAGPALDVWLRGPASRRDADRTARILAEAQRAQLEALELDVVSVRVAPGMLITLEGLPDAGLPSELLVTRVEHHQPLRVRAVAGEYRVPPTTPRPVQAAPLTAFVMGPDRRGEEPGGDVHTDALGRVKIRYPWDRDQPHSEQASDWVPVMQDQTGGSCSIPRVGSEVLVHFIEGDPDRPVVLGRLYNGGDPFPEALPEGKTMSALRSPSSPNRGGKNMIRIDDRAGAERVDIEAERDQRVVVARDERRDVGAARAREVLGAETVSIGNDATAGVGGSAGLVVGGDVSWTVGTKRSVRVGRGDALVAGGRHRLAIGASHLRRVGGPDKVQAGEIDERTGGAHVELALRGISLSARRAVTTVTGGASVGIAVKGHKSSTMLVRGEAVGGLAISKSVADTELKALKSYDLKAGGAVLVNADSAQIRATTLEMDALTSFDLAAESSIVLQVEDNEVRILPDAILVKAKKVLIDGNVDLEWEEAEVTE